MGSQLTPQSVGSSAVEGRGEREQRVLLLPVPCER